jgi:DNA-binding response OmpR family regulator
MIIEDEPDAAQLFAETMRVSGLRVLKSYTSTPAMMLIAEARPDVIILDIMTPPDIRLGLEAGPAAYLTKPVGFTALKNAADRVVQGL